MHYSVSNINATKSVETCGHYITNNDWVEEHSLLFFRDESIITGVVIFSVKLDRE